MANVAYPNPSTSPDSDAMASANSSPAFNSLVGDLNDKCQSALATGTATTTDQQVEKILSAENGIHFENWYGSSFLPAYTEALQTVAKSTSEATKHKEFAELYRSMVNDEQEMDFARKAFQSLNKAILWAPSSERHFLFDCFAYRSNLHYRTKDYTAALVDIDHALALRPSMSCIERKIELLKRFDRGAEAYSMVAGLIANRQITDAKKVEQLRQWKGDLKQFKSKEQQQSAKKDDPGADKPTYYISLSERITMYRDEYNKRCGLKATADLGEDVKLIIEQPTMTALMPSANRQYCNYCLNECANTFWPCPDCPDVIFCSEDCAKADTDHRAECGITGLIFKHMTAQAMQAYRLLARQGPENLISTDQKIKLFPCRKLIGQLSASGQPHCDRALVQQLFAGTQAELRHRLAKCLPTRQCVELSSAVLLVALYMAKNGVTRCVASPFDQQTVDSLVRILALELAKVELTEYGWHEEANGGEKIRLSSFQCLIGSRVGHSCKPNAEWNYDHRAQRYLLKTTKFIKKGDTISITYGNMDSYSFIERQSRLQAFTIMCACALCTRQSRDCFALRCEHCNGAIPYDEKTFHNQQCMQCEAIHQQLTKTKVKNILRDFRSVQSTVALLGKEATEAQLRWIERKMSTLAVTVDLHNHQLQAMIGGLCEEYIRRKQYAPAVEWYKWLYDAIEVHLCSHQDPFVHFSRAERWVSTYIAFVEQCRKKRKQEKKKKLRGKATDMTGHLEVGESIFKTMFSLLEMLNVNSGQYDERIIERTEYENLIKTLCESTKEKHHKFQSLASKAQKSKAITGNEVLATSSCSDSDSGDVATKRKADLAKKPNLHSEASR